MSVYLYYDGAPTLLDELLWQVNAACGCVSGAICLNPKILTPSAAKADFNHHIQRLIDADTDTYTLKSRADFPWDDFKGRCPHDPKWGRDPLPQIEGHAWHTTIRGSSLHLVGPQANQWSRFPVCSSTARLWPATVAADLRFIPCKKCLTWAKSNGGAS